MNAIQKHFARLRELLPANDVTRLEKQYKTDAAADSRASRQRQRLRQAQQRLARSNQEEGQDDEQA